jgi:hypothetical protein
MEETLGAAWMAQAPPYILANRVTAYMSREAVKGCLPDLAPAPVHLEPVYQPLGNARALLAQDSPPTWAQAPLLAPTQLLRLRVWISPDQSCDWNRAELLLKQLALANHRLALELVGNRENLQLILLCHRDDYLLVRTAFRGVFEQCQLIPLRHWPLPASSDSLWDSLVFADFFPSPPYSHLFTQPQELRLSIFGPVMAAMMDIQPPALGLYQVLIQPVSPLHNWHQNVQQLLDLEFRAKLHSGGQLAQRYAQQAPSGDLRHMAVDTETKAHNDKPFYAGALRVAIIGADKRGEAYLRSGVTKLSGSLDSPQFRAACQKVGHRLL